MAIAGGFNDKVYCSVKEVDFVCGFSDVETGLGVTAWGVRIRKIMLFFTYEALFGLVSKTS